MERLTDRNADGNYFYPKCFEKCDGLGASRKCDNCEITTSICEKLGKYEDLEEQGRLVKLPCKVGDTVYLIKNSEKIVERKADMMFIGVLWEEFGKEWFPTRDEAEAKLKELRGGENDG